MPEIDKEFLSVFLEEAEDIVQRLEEELVELEKEKNNPEVINKVFRSFHTIKGSGGMIGLTELSDYTHHIESILDQARNGEREIDDDMISLFLKGLDKIRTYIGHIKKGELIEHFFDEDTGEQKNVKNISDKITPQEDHKEDLIVLDIQKPEKQEEQKVEDDSQQETFYYQIVLAFKENILHTGANPLLFFKELAEVGKIEIAEIDERALPPFSDLDYAQFYLKWNILFTSSLPKEKIEEIFIFVKDDHPIQIQELSKEKYEEKKNAKMDSISQVGTILLKDGVLSEKDLEEAIKNQKSMGKILVESGYIGKHTLDRVLEESNRAKSEKEQSFIRVNTEKLDRLLNFVSELIISHSRVYSLINKLAVYAADSMEISNVISTLENLTREIQEQVMSIRMIPLGPTFLQFNRLVRELSKKQGKKIELTILGSETELDKNMIELISDPLKHMVRNAIDHGLESPEERKKRGKPETGNLILEAYYKEGNVVIEIRDDGRGLDKTKILAKAVEKGLVPEDSHLSEKEIYDLIFKPGFSTAEQVTEISGRGVGMDVVKQNIEKLRGKIDISSEEGKGTTFKIILPLTMAIIDGMLIKVNETFYVIPLLSIIESFKPETDIVSSVEGEVEVIEYRNEYIPLIRLNSALYNTNTDKPITDSILIIVESNGKKYGFQADELIGQHQIVVKSLETNYKNVEGIAGATILGDGRVALILDIEGIVKNVMNQKRE